MRRSSITLVMAFIMALGLWAVPLGAAHAGSGPTGGPATGNVNPSGQPAGPVLANPAPTGAQQQLLAQKAATGAKLAQLWDNYSSGRMTWSQYLTALPNQGPRSLPTGVTPSSSSQTILSPFTYVIQQCGNYCGPATSYEINAYYHAVHGNPQYTQTQWAAAEGTGACNTGPGTCIWAIRNSLNSYIPYGYWVDYHVVVRNGDHGGGDYSWHLYNDIYYYSQPLGNLVNPNPPDGTPYALYGYYGGSTSIIHYVASYGYSGNYNGSDGSQSTYYADSNNACCSGNHTVSTNAMADTITYNNGTGGCDGNNDINY